MSSQRSKKKDKKEAQQLHARKRAAQRFGLTFGPQAEHEVILQIQNQKASLFGSKNKATFVAKESLRVSVWLVTLKDGSKAKAVYDKQRKTIVTLLLVEE